MSKHIVTRAHILAARQAQIRGTPVRSTPTQAPNPPRQSGYSELSWIGNFATSQTPLPPLPQSVQADTGLPFSASDTIVLPTDPAFEQSELCPPDQTGGRSVEYEVSVALQNPSTQPYCTVIGDHNIEGDSEQSDDEEHEDRFEACEREGGDRNHPIGGERLFSSRKARRKVEKVNEGTDPWPSLTHFHTHTLFRSPHLGFSREQQIEILYWAKICGMPNVPTLYSLTKCDERLEACGESPTRRFVTSTGDILYMNELPSGVRQDFSNKSIRELMKLYPSDGEGPKTEFWDGDKLTSGELADQLTPMAASPSNLDTHYFVNELCELDDGDLFIPQMFFERRSYLWAHGYLAACSVKDGQICISVSEERKAYPLAQFRRNCMQIFAHRISELMYDELSSYYQQFLPHPLRMQANGRAVYSVPMVVFQDDVSANRSKQWNKHHVVYTSNAALPRKELNKPRNIKFAGSSPYSKPLEMMGCVRTMCE